MKRIICGSSAALLAMAATGTAVAKDAKPAASLWFNGNPLWRTGPGERALHAAVNATAPAPPAGITAKAVIAEVEAARPAMTDAEAREALRPSDKEAIRKASDFRKKMKAKVPAE